MRVLFSAIGGPIPPWPSSPWHLAHAAVHSARRGPRGLRRPARRVLGQERLEAARPGPRRASSCACAGCRRTRRRRRSRRRPSGGREVELVRLPGDRVPLAGQLGHPPGVVDVLRAQDERHLPVDGEVQRVERERPVRVLVLPVELVRRHVDDEDILAGLGRRLDVRDLREREDRDRERGASAGITVQMISTRVFPWICGPSTSPGAPPRRRKRTMKVRSVASTRTNTTAATREDDPVDLVDRVAAVRRRVGRRRAWEQGERDEHAGRWDHQGEQDEDHAAPGHPVAILRVSSVVRRVARSRDCGSPFMWFSALCADTSDGRAARGAGRGSERESWRARGEAAV